jgi:threonine dehydrogenase-like Zn-dependent dehydrogenase
MSAIESASAQNVASSQMAARLSSAIPRACPDLILECTGVVQVALDVMSATRPAGLVCLLGVSPAGRKLGVDVGALDGTLVLENDVVFGSVNANRRHYVPLANTWPSAIGTETPDGPERDRGGPRSGWRRGSGASTR